MRILIVSQYFWPEAFRINDLALGLHERGHAVTVLTGMPNYPGGEFFPGYGLSGPTRQDYHGIEVVRVPLLPRGNGNGPRLAINYLSFAASASLLGPLRCRGQFDLIFVYEPSPITVGIPALLLKRLKGAPVMFWVQDLWPESLSATGAVRSPMILGMVERLVRFIYQSSDLLLVQAEGFVPRVEKVGANPRRVRYFPNWAEGLYQPVELETDAPERNELPNGFRVLFAGNVGAAQDFPTILAAAERLRGYNDIQWIILGDGRMYDWVKTQVANRNLSSTVHLFGSRPVESMPRYFSLADALLVTLRRDPIFALTIPAKVQSYLACGRPVIGALEGEGASVIRDAGAGLISPPEDANALAEVVLAMYRMPTSERQTMGLQGRAYYESHFEREMLLDRLVGWMQELTQNGIMPRR